LKDDFPSVNWVSVDIHNDPTKLCGKFGITQVPALVCVLMDGSVHKHSGGDAIGYFKLMNLLK
jgi:hypothetical protein